MTELLSNQTTRIKQRGLLHSTGTVSAMTLLSRIAGLTRDMIVANVFGAIAAVDAFYVIFKIPNFLRRLFAEGAFSQAFVPILAEYNQQRSHNEVQEFVNRIAGTLGFVLFVLTVIAVLAAPILTLIFAPGFSHDASRFALASYILRITFPYLMFISLTAFAGAILNSYGQFMVPAFTSVLLNLSMIVAALFVAPYFSQPVLALAWGVFVGGVMQLLFQLPFLYRLKLLPRPKFAWYDPGVRKVIKLMVPALLGVSVAQVNLMVDSIFASFLKVGSVSWLYFADRLMSFPVGVFGVAIATVVLPHLARKHVNQAEEAFAATLDWSIRCILVIGLPAALGLAMLAEPLFTSLFQYGKFTAWDTKMASQSLCAYAVGVPFIMLVKTLVSGFYAKQNIRTPVRIAIIAMVSNTVLCLLLIKPLAHVGLALATSCSALLNVGLLAYGLYKRKIMRLQPGWQKFLLRLAIANVLMAGILCLLKGDMAVWSAWHGLQRAWHLTELVALAVVSYISCLYLTGMRLNDLR
jgi:putative peptidoglycan lipid II flippase